MKITNELINKILELNSFHKTNKEISLLLSISQQSIRKYLKLHNKNMHSGKSLKLVDLEKAICSKCDEIKLLSQFGFHAHKKGQSYRRSYCNTCRYIQTKKNITKDYTSYLTNKWRELKKKCIKFNINFDLERNDLIELYESQNGKCFYSDESFKILLGKGNRRDSISLDRIVGSAGYVKGNLVLCINRINTAKSDFSLDEIRKWMPEWYNRLLNSNLINKKYWK